MKLLQPHNRVHEVKVVNEQIDEIIIEMAFDLAGCEDNPVSCKELIYYCKGCCITNRVEVFENQPKINHECKCGRLRVLNYNL